METKWRSCAEKNHENAKDYRIFRYCNKIVTTLPPLKRMNQHSVGDAEIIYSLLIQAVPSSVIESAECRVTRQVNGRGSLHCLFYD